eukprot:CCRYP_017353-RA/>CCRYP_017353-RA protein AED:0.10 eAED:0.19 QI:644/0/0.33/0.66/1/1/3/0/331
MVNEAPQGTRRPRCHPVGAVHQCTPPGQEQSLPHPIPQCLPRDKQQAHRTNFEQHALINHTLLCQNGIALVIQRKTDYWRSIKSLSFSTRAAKVDGNVGQKRGFVRKEVVMGHFWAFFCELENLGKVRATRQVRNISGVANHDVEDEKIIYLLQSNTVRKVYGRYLDELGFGITTYGNGNYVVTWLGEGEQPAYPDFSTFHSLWKGEFGHVKFLGGGDEPGELERGDEPGELGFGDEPGDEEENTTIADDDEAEEEAPGDHRQLASLDPSVQDPTTKDESAEEPSLEQLEQLTAEIEADGMEMVEQLNRLRGTESRERMILWALEHLEPTD